MIRVVYRWRVNKAQESEFRAAWAAATTTIRDGTAGARGSLMLHSREEPSEFVTIARWDSLEDWQAFWNGKTPDEMKKMHELAERLSVEVFEEVEDHTV